MPLVFWAAQTLAASTLLGVGAPKLTSYISPTFAATIIQQTYRLNLIRQNRCILPCLCGPYKSQPGCKVATDKWVADLNSSYCSNLASMY
jgi:hypothetical protein